MEPASAFGLIKSAYDAVRGVVGAVVPKLELTYEAGKAPYFEADEYVTFAAAVGGGAGPATSVAASSPRRWFRVGIKNHSAANC